MLISKKDEVHLVLSDVEPAIAAELNDFFTFEVPGHKFMPAFRSRMWDGKIRLFNMHTGEIYVGLLPYIEEYLHNSNVKFELETGVVSKKPISRKNV